MGAPVVHWRQAAKPFGPSYGNDALVKTGATRVLELSMW
jgi:hypothetical protein